MLAPADEDAPKANCVLSIHGQFMFAVRLHVDGDGRIERLEVEFARLGRQSLAWHVERSALGPRFVESLTLGLVDAVRGGASQYRDDGCRPE